ncbi:MAG: hypothetical protein U5J63_05405 [Fodinibius sp.]|nr:hypothetical protein [Fodinibius sp.]
MKDSDIDMIIGGTADSVSMMEGEMEEIFRSKRCSRPQNCVMKPSKSYVHSRKSCRDEVW